MAPHKTPQLERVLARCELVWPTACWEWKGSLSHNGYPFIWWDDKNQRGSTAIYRTLVGEIPEGMVLDHICRNRKCLNPDHLEIVTQKENLLRGKTKAAENAAKTHCIAGHPLSGSNLYVTPDGRRQCRACVRRRGNDDPKGLGYRRY